MAKDAMTLKSLMQTNQIRGQEIADDQAMRSAYRNNMKPGPDGLPTLDRSGLLGDLAISNPAAVPGKMLDFQKQDADQAAIQTKVLSDHLQNGKMLINRYDPSATPEERQATWSWIKQTGAKLGMPNTDKLPDQDPGPEYVGHMQATMLSAEEKLKQQNEQVSQATERAKANASLAEAGLTTLPAVGGASNQGSSGQAAGGNPLGTGGFSPAPKMRQKAMEDYNSAVAGSRMQPDASQALKDIQAGQKLSEIASLAPGGDLNKLNNQQTKLAITELVKMAGGTAPTESELHEMTPDNLAQKYAGHLQSLTNKSQPANAGEFIQQGIDYANGIQKLGAQKLSDRANEFADRQRPYLGEQQYKQVKAQIANEFRTNSPAFFKPSGEGKYIPSPAEAFEELKRRQKNKTAGNN